MQKTTISLFSAFVSVMAVYFCFPGTAHAYLDPGSGSFILQMLVAGLLGALFYVKTTWERIKIYLESMFSKNKDQQEKQVSDEK